MPTAIFKALECTTTEDLTKADSCRLEIFVDSNAPITLKKDVNTGERWLLNRSFAFQSQIRVKLWDEDWPDSDDFLGEYIIQPQLKHRGAGTFKEDEADYTLWYEVIASGANATVAHRPTEMSFRQMLGRLGRGVLTASQHNQLLGGTLLYRAHQVISLRETMQFHAQQDGGKGNTDSARTWIYRHCNPWGEESVIPISILPRAFRKTEIAAGQPNWTPVKDEKSYCVAGFQHYSRQTNEDNPISHETMDWNWDQILDPAFTYMLGYTAKRMLLSGGVQFPYIHNEFETGSFPIQWRPFWGEYVTVWGRHIQDRGHMPITTEIHPAHSIVREHTTAAPLGNGGTMVPVNRAIIGMGFSGGFPGNTEARWNQEFGGRPSAIWGDTKACWPTNLKKNPLKFKLFPPGPRPSSSAVLRSRVVLCELIQVSTWSQADAFLERCQEDDPAAGGEKLGFRRWDRGNSLPRGFVPQVAPTNLHPRFTLQDGSYFEVQVDLNAATQIPVGYYAIVECGWSERGNHSIYEFDVTFESVKAVEINDHLRDDWHLYYGVNGQWFGWWTSNLIAQGSTYTHNRTFKVWTVDNMPLSIRDCGIEWDGTDFDSETLDRMGIVASGPRHLERILNGHGSAVQRVEPLDPEQANWLRFKVQAWKMQPQDTKHEWTIKVVRRAV